jgi:hypothetical protein
VKRSTFLAGIGLAMQILVFVPMAIGHGDLVSRKGGIAVAAGEMTIEFVIAPGKVSVYLNDHGDSVSIAGATGTLVVGVASPEERAIPMRAVADDAFEAHGISPQRGEQIKFFAKMADGQVHVVQVAIP